MNRTFNESWRLHRSYDQSSRSGYGDQWWETGFVSTPHGVVGTYRQGDMYTLTVVVRGRMHRRNVRRHVSPRGLVTVAGRFAKEITEARRHA